MPKQSVALFFLALFLSFVAQFSSVSAAEPATEYIEELAPARIDYYGDPLPTDAITRLGTLRMHLNAQVPVVALSPDGTLVAAGQKVWDTATGKEVFRIPPKLSMGMVVAFSADGQTLIAIEPATASIFHFKLATGELVKQTKGEEDTTLNFSRPFLSADRTKLALTDINYHFGLYDVVTGKRIFTVGKDYAFLQAAVSHDGKTVATCGSDKIVRIWDSTTGKETRQMSPLASRDGWCFGIQFAPDDKRLAAIGWGGLQVYDVATGKDTFTISEANQGRPAYSPDGKYLVFGRGMAVSVCDADNGKEIRQFKAPLGTTVVQLAFSDDGKHLAFAGRDHTVGSWDFATGKLLLPALEGHGSSVIAIALSADNKTLVSGSRDDGIAYIWDVRTGRLRHRLPGHFREVPAIAISPDGKLVATGCGYPGPSESEKLEKIRLWAAATGTLIREFDAHPGGVFALAFSPDGKSLVSGGGDASAKLWEVATGKFLKERLLDHRKDFVKLVAFAADGKSAALGCGRGEGIVWKFEGEQDHGFIASHGSNAIAYVENGKKLVVVETNDSCDVHTYDLTQKNPSRQFATSKQYLGLGCAAVSPDGSLVATCGDLAKEIRVWDTATGKPIVSLKGHSGNVTTLAFSADSKMLVSGSDDTTLLLWDIPRARFNDLWTGLTFSKDANAEPSIKMLITTAKESVPYLAERLQRLARVEARVRKLAENLNEDDIEVREKATRQLEALGPDAEFAFRLVLVSPLTYSAMNSRHVSRTIDASSDSTRSTQRGGHSAGCILAMMPTHGS